MQMAVMVIFNLIIIVLNCIVIGMTIGYHTKEKEIEKRQRKRGISMADIELVIKVSEDIYKEIMAHNRERREGGKSAYYFEELIQNGTPLPKGHGRLIDKDHVIARLEAASKFYGGENADAFDERFSYGLKEAAIKVCGEPTIIEADVKSNP